MTHPELNFRETGGAFGRVRIFPGFTITRNAHWRYVATREGEQTASVVAMTWDQLAKIMRTYRNPYTGEGFPLEPNPENGTSA